MADAQRSARGASSPRGPDRRFSKLLDQVPALHYIADLDTGQLLHLSGEVEVLTGYTRDECLAAPAQVRLVIHPDDREEMVATVEAESPDGPPRSARYRLLHRDGTYRWVQDRGRVVRYAGRRVAVGVITDITAYRDADMADAAERERAAAGERAVALTRLAGGIAHQFNNLLTAITGYTALAHESLDPDDPARELLDEALAAAGRAREVAASLLAFAGGVVLRPTEADLNAITGSAIARAWPPANRNGIRVDFHDGPLPILGDPARLEDAIAGLLVAVRGLEAGAPLLVRTLSNGDAAAVELVEPTGRLGDDPSALVQPFRRPPERVAVDDLAFAAADGIARGSGGFLDVRADDEGTVVRFSVPALACAVATGPDVGIVEADAATPARPLPPGLLASLGFVAAGRGDAPEGSVSAPSSDSAPRRVVLVVDDDDGVRTFMHALVDRSGLTPMSAGSAADAMSILASGVEIDALVADVVMPGMGGVELAAWANEIRPGLPILFVSGDPGKHLPADLRSRPFLAKPFGPKAFRDALGALLVDAPSPTAPESPVESREESPAR